MNRMAKWAFFLNKRLYKKLTFLILLILIPTLVFCYGIFAQQDSGMITIAVALEDPTDPFTVDFADRLQNTSELILFSVYDDPESAVEGVRYGKADAAWIFPADLSGCLADFAENRFDNGGFVRVVIREKTMPVMLTLEKLGAMLFNGTARELFADYIQFNLSETAVIDEASILAHYDTAVQDGELFEYAYPNEGSVPENARNYLLSPLRGLLGILIAVSSLVTAMYYTEDQHKGLFSWIPQGSLGFVELGYQIISVGNLMAFVWLGLSAVGLTAGFFTELIIAVLYMLCCASFGQMVRVWCKNVVAIGMLLPVLTVCMLVLCPIFFDFGGLRDLGYLFPPTYYINSAFRSADIGSMAVYTLCCSGLYWAGKRIR